MDQHGKYRSLVTGLALGAALLFAAPAHATCRLALALGLDISGSVDEQEYSLQLDGLAQALTAPDVRAAFLAMPDVPVRLFIYEWSGTTTQNPIISWRDITDNADLDVVANLLRRHARVQRPPGTALGQAMAFGAAALSAQNDCWRQTLDISADGQSNMGPRPRDLEGGLFAEITVNGLIVGSVQRHPTGPDEVSILDTLEAYFRAEVIRGPDAFIEKATGYDDYAAAMERKLLRELNVLILGAADQ